MKFSIILFVVFILLQLTSAYKWTSDQIPNPMSSPPPFCNLPRRGVPFCDPESILDQNHSKFDLMIFFKK